MITEQDYFNDSVTRYGYAPTALDRERADDLLTRVSAIEADWVALGHPELVQTSGHRTRQKTLDLIASGVRAALGGNHERSLAIDIADPNGELDEWLTDERLTSYGLWREAPPSTPGWVHVQTVAPKSGHRTFFP